MGVHAGIVCRLGVLGKGIGGERDDGDIGCIDLLAQTNRAGCLIAVHVRHHNVHQNEMDVVFLHSLQRLASIVRLKEAVIPA